MPAKSQAQQKFMGIVHALNKGDVKPSDVSQSVKDVAKTIKKSDAKDFASTKHNKIPKKVKEQLLTAFKEYANKMAGNKLGGSGSYGYAPQKGLRDDDGYDNVDYNRDMPRDESVNEAKSITLIAFGGRKTKYNNSDIDKFISNLDLNAEDLPGLIYKASMGNSNIIGTNAKSYNKKKEAILKLLKKIKSHNGNVVIDVDSKNPSFKHTIKFESINEEPKDEGFASDAQRRAAFASGYKAKGKKGKKESSKYRSLFYTNEGMFSTLDQIRQDSKDVRDFVKNVFKDRDFMKMKNDKEFIKYLKSIYEGKMPNNWMSGRVSDYHTALRGKNRDYSGGTNFKKNNHGQPDIENDDEDQETNSLSVKQTPIKENYMMNRDVEEEMKKHGIKKIPIDSHGDRLLKGLKKEKFINKIDNKLKLTYFYATVPKGQRYNYASLKKPLSPLFNRFMNDLMGENITLTAKMAAYRVSQNIVDMYNNDEEIDSPYYMLKNYFNSFNMDTSRSRVFNGAQYHLDQWLKRNKKYEKAMMKEEMGNLSSSERIELYKLYSKAMKAMPGSPNQKKIKVLINKLRKKADLKPLPINEGISVFDERHFGKKGIIIMIDDNGKKVSAIFKDKKNADKFNRNKPSDIKKLLQLAKKTKFPKTIDEYGQRLDLSFIDDKEARLKGTPEPKDAIDRDIDETTINEIGLFPITNYMTGIIPSNFIDTTTRQKKERLKSTLRDLKSTLNHFWKSHKIPYRIR